MEHAYLDFVGFQLIVRDLGGSGGCLVNISSVMLPEEKLLLPEEVQEAYHDIQGIGRLTVSAVNGMFSIVQVSPRLCEEATKELWLAYPGLIMHAWGRGVRQRWIWVLLWSYGKLQRSQETSLKVGWCISCVQVFGDVLVETLSEFDGGGVLTCEQVVEGFTVVAIVACRCLAWVGFCQLGVGWELVMNEF